MTKEICSKCGPERICKNTNGGRRLIQNDDTVLQLHVPIEGCPIVIKESIKKQVDDYIQELEGIEESVEHYERLGGDKDD